MVLQMRARRLDAMQTGTRAHWQRRSRRMPSRGERSPVEEEKARWRPTSEVQTTRGRGENGERVARSGKSQQRWESWLTSGIRIWRVDICEVRDAGERRMAEYGNAIRRGFVQAQFVCLRGVGVYCA
jgi:hypothetical protein